MGGKAESDGAVERASDWDPEFTQMLRTLLAWTLRAPTVLQDPGLGCMTGTTSSSRTPNSSNWAPLSTQIVEKLTSLRVFGYMTGVCFMLSNEIKKRLRRRLHLCAAALLLRAGPHAPP